MRILFLGEPKSPNTISWVEGLRNLGCEVFLASVRTDGSDGNIPIGNVNFPPRVRILTGVRDLERIIGKVKPDILIAYRITSYGYLAARTGFHPLVLAAQNEQIVYLPEPSTIRRNMIEHFVRYALKKADLVHSWGDNITEGLLKYGADESKILTLHRGIDLETFNCRFDSEFDKKSPIFISTRSLHPEYLIDRLLKAFSLFVRKVHGAKFEIAGSGPEEPFLKQLVQNLGLGNNVTFHGRLDKTELIKLMQSANIYASVIQTEGISSSLIESVICGMVPIVADMPSSRMIVSDRNNGFLVRSISPESLSEIMFEAVSSYEEMKPALQKNAESIMLNFSRNKNQKIFVEKYNYLLGKHIDNDIYINCPEIQKSDSKTGVLVCADINAGNIDRSRLKTLSKIASKLPEIPFYIIGEIEEDRTTVEFLNSLPYNCLHINDKTKIDWAMDNCCGYCHMAKGDFSAKYLKKALKTGLTGIISDSAYVIQDMKGENIGSFNEENLYEAVKIAVYSKS